MGWFWVLFLLGMDDKTTHRTRPSHLTTTAATPPGPMIALSMGERGQIVRLLAAKYGGHLTFAAMSPERASAPGQPDIGRLAGLFNYRKQVGAGGGQGKGKGVNSEPIP